MKLHVPGYGCCGCCGAAAGGAVAEGALASGGGADVVLACVEFTEIRHDMTQIIIVEQLLCEEKTVDFKTSTNKEYV